MNVAPFASRLDRLRGAMVNQQVDVVLVSVGADLPWLVGYEAMPLERLTMLVVPRDGEATLVVPRLEAPRVHERSGLFTLRPWEETEDAVTLVAGLAAGSGSVSVAAIGDRTWAGFLVDLQTHLPKASFRRASTLTGPLRARKDTNEIAALHRAGAAADEVARALQRGDIPLVGHTEAEVSAEIGTRLLAAGHQRVNFAIVASGPNAASPHHDAGERVIGADEVVLCDFGGSLADEWGVGYCSDITRCVWTGTPSGEVVEIYALLQSAQEAAVRAAVVGASCEAVDQVARRHISSGGYGEAFMHRTGHGIGVEEHEAPYLVAGNSELITAGHSFSVEPGIYLPGRFGFRLEDCLAATPEGPDPYTTADHRLIAVQA